MMHMKVGDVTPMTNCTVMDGTPKNYLKVSFKARKGRRFVFLFLGDESLDESDRLDPEKRLTELGWKKQEV